MDDLALSNCHTPKRPVIKNIACDNHTPKLNMACVGACVVDCMAYLARAVLGHFI